MSREDAFGIRVLGGRVSGRASRRALAASAGLLVAIAAAGAFALNTGSSTLSLSDVVSALLGEGSRRTNIVLFQWRMPRVAAALVFGAALGASGALFQSLTRNPLGSPDVIGFDSGAVTGALIAILILGAGGTGVSVGALVGGLGTALAVISLGLRGAGIRLIVVGIALSASLTAFNQLLIMRADLALARRASSWSLGSVASIGWGRLGPATAVIAVALIAALILARPARMLEMHGDGAQSRPTRFAMVGVGVVLVAVPTSVAGPIVFVALVSPHLARSLTRRPGLSLGPAALMGALLLLLADLAVQLAPTPSALPVGIATLVLGGLYFIYLLIREWRSP